VNGILAIGKGFGRGRKKARHSKSPRYDESGRVKDCTFEPRKTVSHEASKKRREKGGGRKEW